MRDHTFRIALLLGASALPGAVHAEDAATGSEEAAQAAGEGEQIVVTATRTPLAIDDVPATVTVIDAEDIADDMVTDIKDLVRYEPGVSVRRAPARFGAALGTLGRARNEDFVIRGIGGNRVLIQVAGSAPRRASPSARRKPGVAATPMSAWSSRSRSCAGPHRRSMAVTGWPAQSASPPAIRSI